MSKNQKILRSENHFNHYPTYAMNKKNSKFSKNYYKCQKNSSTLFNLISTISLTDNL